MIAAVKAGDRPQVEALLAEDPNLAAATDNGVPAVSYTHLTLPTSDLV